MFLNPLSPGRSSCEARPPSAAAVLARAVPLSSREPRPPSAAAPTQHRRRRPAPPPSSCASLLRHTPSAAPPWLGLLAPPRAARTRRAPGGSPAALPRPRRHRPRYGSACPSQRPPRSILFQFCECSGKIWVILASPPQYMRSWVNLWIQNVLDSVYIGFNWIFKWSSLLY